MLDKLATTSVCIHKNENCLAFTKDCTSTSFDACSSGSIVTYHIFCHILHPRPSETTTHFFYNQHDDEFKWLCAIDKLRKHYHLIILIFIFEFTILWFDLILHGSICKFEPKTMHNWKCMIFEKLQTYLHPHVTHFVISFFNE